MIVDFKLPMTDELNNDRHNDKNNPYLEEERMKKTCGTRKASGFGSPAQRTTERTRRTKKEDMD